MSHLRARISGIASAVPPDAVTNEDMRSFMETDPKWVLQRTGIRQRYWAREDAEVTTAGLGAEASRLAIERAGIRRDELDMIIFATLSPDAVYPGSGCFLQEHLGIEGIPAFDLRQQCAGFLYGLSMADLYVRAGQCRHVLLVGSEIQSKALDKSTRGRDVTVLFGDGAGAAVISAVEVQDADPRTSKESFLISHHLHADGKYATELMHRSPGTMNRIWNPDELVGAKESYPQMNGRLVFNHAVRRMPEVTLEALEANGLAPSDVDLFVLHQANKRINDKFAKAVGVEDEKVFSTIETYGNTTAATIPIGLDEARKQGRLERGMLVASAAFGAGFTWAASLYRW